ncbi:hypothetical protein MmiEs2_01240 [Methanimicrococcus stummii]|uniref:Uncharacterized protein n=1 Tax=Methanimicrococcus stummii TaxID=3028294 RepID=A0AA96V961_9EURY|nr:hypothetical protein [Methanimicrococcus sp. Es2]WNY27945.1 hypothetical protein MmiEs2_01240 [Methanimicrococcus sp. Es2]
MFSEICVYQVKPDKIDEFETLMEEVEKFLNEQDGVLLIRFFRRTHDINDFSLVKEGLPPHKLTRVVKSVRYLLYWEFETAEQYGASQKNLYETYWKTIDKCLLVPHDKYLGETIFAAKL